VSESSERITYTTHFLKSWPEYFQPLADRIKSFEVRRHDRGFNSGERVVFGEFIPCKECGPKSVHLCLACLGDGGRFTGRQVVARIGYVLRNFHGLAPGFCAFSLTDVQEVP
jgi:hypothetical protein